MPSAFRDPKTLPEWIELDGHARRPSGLRRWRTRLTWLAFLGCAAGLGLAAVFPRSSRLYQAQPVSPAHALFNDNCGQCHTEAFQTARRFLPWNAAIHAVSDAACTQCHDGPPHHPEQAAMPACASCHREHQGQVSLARVPDSQCTACHADLKAHARDPGKCPYEDVGGFPERHPEFRLWRNEAPTDPGRLRFNHKAHLPKDGLLAPGGRVELDCADCHQADDAGRYVKPVKYDLHCSRCHPLSVQLSATSEDKDLKAALAQFAQKPAPHDKPPVVRTALRDRLLAFTLEHPLLPNAEAQGEHLLPRPRGFPEKADRSWQLAKRDRPLTPDERREFVQDQLPRLEELLFDRPGGCAHCHREEKPRTVPVRQIDDPLPVYALTNQPARWLEHGRFSHERHRMLRCAECHDAENSTRTAHVLLPRVATCAKCHNDSTGVRHDCVECHKYHRPGAAPGQRRGRTIDESLGR
jgi:hypothetical protein